MNIKSSFFLAAAATALFTACASADKTMPSDVQVYISSGQTQCNNDGMTLAQSKALLTEQEVLVSTSSCAMVTGISYISMCGAETGIIHVHQIKSVNLDKATEAGFKPVGTLQERGLGFEKTSCPSGAGQQPAKPKQPPKSIN
ncbi:hypothetical protein [Thalassotalea agarivorans]|uniref:Lipoprotein n=1 Tax=Thalassotalea agarivorans TaxID=349064 RepID=A0A1I0E721_THASX|nr:hypothetical protein [Thalassotalea agarivorans]SET40997.1 hypothetical protein SAMN05660429_01757 [Thalassotalea agarivorans]